MIYTLDINTLIGWWYSVASNVLTFSDDQSADDDGDAWEDLLEDDFTDEEFEDEIDLTEDEVAEVEPEEESEDDLDLGAFDDDDEDDFVDFEEEYDEL